MTQETTLHRCRRCGGDGAHEDDVFLRCSWCNGTGRKSDGRTVQTTGWQPIETAPKSRTMIVVRAFSVPVQQGALIYTSDPYCVWWDAYMQRWERWPHPYEPTHWLSLPPAPQRSDEASR